MVRKSQADDDEDDTSHGAHCEKIMNSLKKQYSLMFKKINNGNLILPSSTTTQAEKILPYELKQVKKVLAELSWVCLTYKTKDLFCKINKNKFDPTKTEKSIIFFSLAYVRES